MALSQLRDAQLAVQTLEARISAQTVDHARALEGLQEGVVSTAPSSTPGEAMAELQEQYDDLMKRCDFMTEEQMQTDEQLIACVCPFSSFNIMLTFISD